jgi:hypothetical protein
LRTDLAEGAAVAIQFEPQDAPGVWEYLDGVDGPRLQLDATSLATLDTDAGTTGPWVVTGEWTALRDEAKEDVRFRAVLFGGDGDVAKFLVLTRLAVQFTAGQAEAPTEPPEPPLDPGSCDEIAPLLMDGSWTENVDDPGDNVFTVAANVVVLSLTGTGAAERERTFGGFDPDFPATFYLLVDPDDPGVDAYLEVEGLTTESSTATVTGETLLSVTVDPTVDGEVTVRFGVRDASGGAVPAGDDDLQYADQTAAEAGGWVFAGGGSVAFMSRAIGPYAGSIRLRAPDGSVKTMTQTFSVTPGATYTIEAWMGVDVPGTPWWAPQVMSAVSGANTGSIDINGGEADLFQGFSIVAGASSLTVTFTAAPVFGTGTLYIAGLEIAGLGGSTTVTFSDLGFCEGSGLPEEPCEGEDCPEPCTPGVDCPEPPPVDPGGWEPPALIGTRPFGNHNVEAEGYAYWDCGMLRMTPASVVNLISKARAAGTKLMLSCGPEAGWLDGSGRFSYDRWNVQMTALYTDARAREAIEDGVTDGTVFAHYVIDEPFHLTRYGVPIPFATVERMMQRSKELFPAMRTLTRVDPTDVRYTRAMVGLDCMWAEYSLARGPIDSYLSTRIAAAENFGHELVLGIHYKHFEGPAGPDPRYIRPDELRHIGFKMATASANPVVVAMHGWRNEAGLVAQSGFLAALKEVYEAFAENDP